MTTLAAQSADSAACAVVVRGERRSPVIAAVGNPNTGKSTLFNALTGLRQKVGNYAGVTVEQHAGTLTLDRREVRLIDLPGTYSLAAQSPDEIVAVDVLLGRVPDTGRPDVVLVVTDASNLRRNLYLASQVLEMGLPVVIALNMADQARSKGIVIDAAELARRLEAPVVPIVASRGEGLAALRATLAETLASGRAPRVMALPELRDVACLFAEECLATGVELPAYEIERALVDQGGYAERRLIREGPAWLETRLRELRESLAGEQSLAALEARRRYQWINTVLSGVERRTPTRPPWSDRVDRFASHPVLGSLLFVLLMGVVFQSVFSWATPMMELLDAGSKAAGALARVWLPAGALASLVTDGMIAGVGSVVVFLPQILILSTFIIFLEDSGYMARAAFLMDRLMRWCGLSGQSFIPMLSSFACAVPGIMATRVIPNPRDRLATILAAPFMTCSARLPIYALLIAAFIPPHTYLYGMVNLQGLVLLGLYLLGIGGGIATAWVIKRTLLRGPAPMLLMELPPYRAPRPGSVLLKLRERARIFLVRAGTIIFTVSVVVWALAYFPHPPELRDGFDTQRNSVSAALAGEVLQTRLADIDRLEAAAYLEQSTLGRIGRLIEPAFSPLGWDWKVSAAVIASFPAREVVIGVLGTIYAVGSEVDEQDAGLIRRLRQSAWPDGTRVFSVSMAIGLMVFYAFCLQCGATVAIIGRETNSWRWPAFAWVYMTALGYLGALLCMQIGRVL